MSSQILAKFPRLSVEGHAAPPVQTSPYDEPRVLASPSAGPGLTTSSARLGLSSPSVLSDSTIPSSRLSLPSPSARPDATIPSARFSLSSPSARPDATIPSARFSLSDQSTGPVSTSSVAQPWPISLHGRSGPTSPLIGAYRRSNEHDLSREQEEASRSDVKLPDEAHDERYRYAWQKLSAIAKVGLENR